MDPVNRLDQSSQLSDLLCRYDDDGWEEDKGPEKCEQTIEDQPWDQETVLVLVPQLEVLSPAGGKGKEGGVLPEARQADSVEESCQAKQTTCRRIGIKDNKDTEKTNKLSLLF